MTSAQATGAIACRRAAPSGGKAPKRQRSRASRTTTPSRADMACTATRSTIAPRKSAHGSAIFKKGPLGAPFFMARAHIKQHRYVTLCMQTCARHNLKKGAPQVSPRTLPSIAVSLLMQRLCFFLFNSNSGSCCRNTQHITVNDIGKERNADERIAASSHCLFNNALQGFFLSSAHFRGQHI